MEFLENEKYESIIIKKLNKLFHTGGSKCYTKIIIIIDLSFFTIDFDYGNINLCLYKYNLCQQWI